MGRQGNYAHNRASGKTSVRRNRRLLSAARASFEQLENRTLLSLLGVSPGYPSIAYDTTGVVNYTYNSSTSQGSFVASASPKTFTMGPSGPSNVVIPSTTANPKLSVSVTLTLDSNGNIIPSPTPNLVVDGRVTVSGHTYDGVLLEGDIDQFGFSYSGTTTNEFDFRFAQDSSNPGLLASFFGSNDIGMTMLSAHSTFVGSFALPFTGGTNGAIGPISPVPPQLGSLTGTVFEDFANNGIYESPDTPIQGVEVVLSGTDFQGNTVSETTFTGVDGSYLFSNLEPSGPAGYTIDEIQSTVPSPLLDGKDSIGTLGGNSSVQDEFSAIQLGAGQNGVFYNFGEIPPGSISGIVYCDDNTNGAYDTGTDYTIGGAVLTLSGTNDLGNNVTQTLNSASDGSYDFTGLRPGTYTVSVTNSDTTHTLETAGSIGPASLGVGANTTGDNFGYVQLTPVSGQVLNDSTSTGINGVQITLTGLDYTNTLVSESTTTSGNGNFSFGSLLPGSYTITEAPVVGYFPDQNNTGTNTFSLAGCDNANVVATFGENPPVSISGFKYDDLTGNGITSDDTGLAGVTINLYATGVSAPVATTTTASDGSYSFTGLIPGNYSVQEVVPAGWVQTAGIGGYNITAAPGSSSTGNNFADFQLISISGTKDNDVTGNGFSSDDVGLAGVTIDLFDNGGSTPIATTTTDSNGNYSFSNLGPGSYSVQEVVPGGWTQTGGIGGYTNTATSGQNISGDNFDDFQNMEISGIKVNDLTGAGLHSDNTFGNDPLLAGVVIDLFENGSSTPVATATTDSHGFYAFTNLGPGNYSVQEVVPAGWTQTYGMAGYTLNSKTAGFHDGADFADFQNISISGTKYNDLTGNGFSSDDTPQSGVTIDLFLNGGSTPVATAVTASNGSYSFTNLGPGNYSVQEVVPAGAVQTGGIGGYTVSATSGQNVTGDNFDNFQSGSISGKKFTDITGNGFSSDDTGLAGVTIDLFANGGASPVATTTTASDGSYSFTNLGPGSYSVQEVVPDGWTQTGGIGGYSNTLTSGQSVTTDNFDDFQNISISGTKYTDITGNGFSSDDTGQGGVTINLFENGGSTPVATTTTASNGGYSFSNLGPGSYSVQEVVPTGWTQTGGIGGYTNVATSGQNVSGDNFDNFQNISISGTKYTDITGNGFSSDDTGQGGVTINLLQNGGSSPVATTTTASNGTYSFTNLGPGSYSVQEVVPTGWIQTGGIGGYSNSATSGQNVSGDNFDNFQTISISGTKYNDITGNGFSSDDTPQAGITIDLFQNGGTTPIATTVTASNGTYSFSNLGPGKYFVQEVTPAGSIETAGTAGYTISATSGTNSTGDNFDNFQTASISGTKYNDLTDNGITSDDVGLGGVTIDLFQNGGTTAFETTVTASNGTYSFTNLGPGTYKVQEVVPAGWTQTAGNAGYTVVATSGVNSTGNNFADFKPISISGTKYTDLTGNGFSSDDTPLAGVTINLYKNGGTSPFATTTTAANGTYSFTNLAAATYVVNEVVPTGWTQTGGVGGYTVAGTSGTNATGENFDDFKNVSISGTKYKDITGNGFSSDDTVLSGVTIDLFKNGGTSPFATTTTATNGTYSFTNLGPGTYLVNEVVPAGWTQTGGIGGYTITPTSGAAITGENFDDFQGISISGTKYDDLTDNGLTSDDTPLGGVTIDLFKNGGTTPVATTVTASNGTYSFTNLGPGTYMVQEVVPSGWVETYGMAGYTTAAKCSTNVSGDNFADFQLLTISGIKYQDLTGNGYSSDDTPLGGVTIQLYKDANKDGKFTSADGGPIATTVTAAGTGAYSFGNLLPGTYFVEEVVPTGWVETGPATSTYYTITATATTKTYTGNNFDDYYEECKLSNTSSYYFLIDGSSTHYTTLSNNVHEGDQVTVVFTLLSGDTISLASYTAPTASWVPAQAPQQVLFDSATGTYATGGTYSLTITVPMCYFQIDYVCGTVINVLGAVGSNILYNNQNRMFQSDNGGTDAQFSGGGSIAGYVFNDVNKDKLMDTGDLGIAGAIVTLTGKDSTGKAITLTRVTDANGYYYFKGLKAGTYTLTETIPTGYTASASDVGTIGGKATGTATSSTVISNIASTLTSLGTNYDFADTKKS